MHCISVMHVSACFYVSCLSVILFSLSVFYVLCVLQYVLCVLVVIGFYVCYGPSCLVGCVAQWAERRSLAGELTLSCARSAADG